MAVRRSSRRRLSVAEATLGRLATVPDARATTAAAPSVTPPAAPPMAPQAAPGAQDFEINTALAQALALIATARRGLLATEGRLNFIADGGGTDTDEQASAGLELLTVVRELELLEARRLALEANPDALRPPSEADIAEAQRLAGALATHLAASAKVAAITGLAADLVRLTEALKA